MTSTFDRKVVVALFVVFTLVLTGCAVCIYRAKASDLGSLRSQLHGHTARLTDIKSKVDRMPQLEAEYDRVASHLAFLEKPLPDAAYIPTFLAQIELLARETKNDIVIIRPKKKPKAGPGGAKGEAKINNETGELVKEDENAADKTEKKAAKDKAQLPYDFIPIEMKIEGTYWTALQFLQQLQRFPKMIAVNTVGFAPRTSAGPTRDDQALSISLDLTAVVMKGAKDGNAQ